MISLPPSLVRAADRWRILPGVVRGPLFVIGSGLTFSGMVVIGKFLGNRMSGVEIAFFRALFGWFALLPFVVMAGPAALRTRRPWAHLIRGLLGSVGLALTFVLVTALPLADFTALNFTKGLFLVVLAALFLGEPFRARRVIATIAGFCGVLVMLQPQAGVSLAALGVLFMAFVNAVSLALIKDMMRTEAPITVMFYLATVTTLALAPVSAVVWITPDWTDLGLILAISVLGTLGQSMQVRAFRATDASVLTPFEYFQLLSAAAFGFIFFGDLPGLWTWMGGAIILAANIYIALRENRARKAPVPKDAA